MNLSTQPMRVFGLTLGDWRLHSTGPSGLLHGLGLDRTPGVYMLSARCCGIKGAVPGARHAWLSSLSRGEWCTLELTDAQTLSLQTDVNGSRATWVSHGSGQQAPYRSNRAPDTHWFGQPPRLESMVADERLADALTSRADRYCADYCFRNDSSLLENNCTKLVSYLLWRIAAWTQQPDGLVPAKSLIGFRNASYWDALYRSTHESGTSAVRDVARDSSRP